MRAKRLFAAAAAIVLASSLFVMPASAHGHHRQTQTVDTGCPVCTVEGCTEEGRHSHDGHNYCGYDHADGYCDGSCVPVQNISRRGCGGRHHRCH